MKVEVLQAKDADFPHLFAWWSTWVDVAVFDHGGTGYLLQMKVSRTNAKYFRATQFSGLLNIAYAATGQVGDLTQMGNKQ